MDSLGNQNITFLNGLLGPADCVNPLGWPIWPYATITSFYCQPFVGSEITQNENLSRTNKCHTYGPRSSRDELILCCFFLLPRNRRRNDLHPICGRTGNQLFSAGFKNLPPPAPPPPSTHIWLHFAGGKSIFFRHVRAPPCFFLLCFVPAHTAGWLAGCQPVRQMETINSSRFYCRRAAPRSGRCTGKSRERFTIRFFFVFSLYDDGDLFVNKRASKCVRTASSWLALRFFLPALL